jgi:Acetyltransferase (GNAT) domain
MQLHGRGTSYRLDPLAWGNAVATEAATAVVAWANTHIPDHPVVARVRPDNTASLKVAARTGLRRTAHLDTAGDQHRGGRAAPQPVVVDRAQPGPVRRGGHGLGDPTGGQSPGAGRAPG